MAVVYVSAFKVETVIDVSAFTAAVNGLAVIVATEIVEPTFEVAIVAVTIFGASSFGASSAIAITKIAVAILLASSAIAATHYVAHSSTIAMHATQSTGATHFVAPPPSPIAIHSVTPPASIRSIAHSSTAVDNVSAFVVAAVDDVSVVVVVSAAVFYLCHCERLRV